MNDLGILSVFKKQQQKSDFQFPSESDLELPPPPPSLDEQDSPDDVPIVVPDENDSTVQEIEAADNDLPAVNYYYTSGCAAHKEIYPLILEAEQDFSYAIRFNEYNVSKPADLKAYNEFAVRHNISNMTRYTPVIEIGNITLTGLWEINKTSLYSALSDYADRNWS